MKIKLFFFSLLLFYSFSGFGQTLFAEFEPIKKLSLLPFFDNVLVSYSQDGEMTICYYAKGYFFYYILNENGKLLNQNSISAGPHDLYVRGTVQTDSTVYFIFYVYDKNSLRILEVDKTGTNTPVLKEHKIINGNERAIATVVSKNEAYIINRSKKEQTINLYRFNKDSKKFDLKKVSDKDKVGAELLRKTKYIRISDTTLPMPSVATSKMKYYLMSPSEIIITNEKGRKTEVIKIDWEVGRVEKKSLEGSERELNAVQREDSEIFVPKMSSSTSHSSYFCDSILYKISASNYALTIDLFNLRDLNDTLPISTYRHVPVDKPNKIVCSDFYQDKNYDYQEIFQLDTINSAEFLRKISAGMTYIHPYKKIDEKWVFRIGSYIERKASAGSLDPDPNNPSMLMTLPSQKYERSLYFYTDLRNSEPRHLEKVEFENMEMTDGIMSQINSYIDIRHRVSDSYFRYGGSSFHISKSTVEQNTVIVVSYDKAAKLIKVHKCNL